MKLDYIFKHSKIRKRAAKHFEGLAALSTHPAGRRAVAAVKQFPRRDLWTNREAYGILIYKRARILAGCRKPETGFFRAPGLCAGGGRCKKEIVWH